MRLTLRVREPAAERVAQHAVDARWQRQQVDSQVAEHEDRDVRDEDDEDDHERRDRAAATDQQRRGRAEQRQCDDRLDRE